MPAQEPIAEPPFAASDNRIGKAAAAVKQMALDYLARAREHQAAFMFTGASALVSVGSMFSSMIMVRYVSPEDLGLWQSVRLAVTYSMFILAGVNNGLSRDLPYYLGKSDEKTASRLGGTTLFYVLGASLLVSLAGAASLMLFHDRGSKLLFAIATVTVLIILTFYTNYLIVTFRSSKSFKDFSKIKMLEALVTVGTIPLLYYLGNHGMLARVLVLSGLVLFFMHLFRPIRVAPAWDGKAFVLLLKTGMPIFILDYISTTAGTCDRLVLLKLGGVKLVGYYAVALMARDAIGIIPGALSEYIYPRMSHSYGQHHDPIRLWKMAVKSSLMVVAFMIPAVAAGWFLMPPVVSKLFPKYTEAIAAAQWILIGSVFGGATLGRMAIWSMKDWKMATWYQGLGVGFGVAGIVLGGYFGKTPLIGVAVGSLIAQIAWLPVGGYLVYLATHRRASPIGK